MQRDFIAVFGIDDYDDILCRPCQTTITGQKVALLLRRGPNEPFDPICLDCAFTILAAAAQRILLYDDAETA